jgi:hypothetical protein
MAATIEDETMTIGSEVVAQIEIAATGGREETIEIDQIGAAHDRHHLDSWLDDLPLFN